MDDNGMVSGRRVPLAAIVLGAAGLLPLLFGLIVRLMADVQPETPLPGDVAALALIYSALILSFLGGIWWGVAATRAAPERFGALIAISVLPTIAALGLMGVSLYHPGIAAVALGVVLMLTPLVDRRLLALRLVPRWWLRLRLPLSLALGILTIGLGLLV